jgi:hypothetical protein
MIVLKQYAEIMCKKYEKNVMGMMAYSHEKSVPALVLKDVLAIQPIVLKLIVVLLQNHVQIFLLVIMMGYVQKTKIADVAIVVENKIVVKIICYVRHLLVIL